MTLALLRTIWHGDIEFQIDITARDEIAATLPQETLDSYNVVRQDLVEAYKACPGDLSDTVWRRVEDLHRMVRLIKAQEKEGQFNRYAKKKSKTQSAKARESRSLAREIVGRVCRSHPDLSAKELWLQFGSELSAEERCDAHQTDGPPGESSKDKWDYAGDRKRGSMTFGTFEKTVSQFRNGKSRLRDYDY